MHVFSRKGRGKNHRSGRYPRGLVIGITGGIATGKSTLAAVLRQRGAGYYSVDEAAHLVYRPGTGACRKIRRAFGARVAGPGGGVDRAKLGAIVMRSANALGRLEGIVHPKLRSEAKRTIRRLRRSYRMLAVEAGPLLFRLGLHREADLVVWTRCPGAVQLSRLRRGRGLSRKAAVRWLRALQPAQSALGREFTKAANVIRIDTNQSPSRMRRAAEYVLRRGAALAKSGSKGDALGYNG